MQTFWMVFQPVVQSLQCESMWYVSTVKPPYSGHSLKQTPLYNGRFSQKRMK